MAPPPGRAPGAPPRRSSADWPAGTLRAGLSPEDAADVAWSLTSHEHYELLVGVRGWTVDRYLAWVKAAVTRELLRRP